MEGTGAGERRPIAVLGAGAWGTALACQLARNGRDVRLWGRDPAQIEKLRATGRNARYLPEIELPPNVFPQPSLKGAVAGSGDILVAVPSGAFRETLTALADTAQRPFRLAWATKGLELDSGKLLHQVAAEVLGDETILAVISGPSFAREVGAGLPTAVTVASTDEAFADALVDAFHGERFRVYTATDLVGVEIGGAVKNVIAIAAGIADGLAFGANARAGLITRGLAEIMRLGAALGARPETLMGLAGLGDLVLTCTGDLSRNRRLGLALAAGKSREAAVAEIGQAVEGIGAAKVVHRLAAEQEIEMPITEQVYRVLYEALGPREAVETLFNRAPKSEFE
ncbi:MAG TPA: NAD(P)H-dependent glycerol-3-phosphate dehydrogenase [Gammaproteobacteria bacterium]|nr:NAD(P)H-dependent glycerol-3-phosphate dehydrogenase [Gammaproteobacteria bacterium]